MAVSVFNDWDHIQCGAAVSSADHMLALSQFPRRLGELKRLNEPIELIDMAI